jgi:hypothetical protein
MPHNIPTFDDEELEIDQVLDSVAWDLCGLRKRVRRPGGPRPKQTRR